MKRSVTDDFKLGYLSGLRDALKNTSKATEDALVLSLADCKDRGNERVAQDLWEEISTLERKRKKHGHCVSNENSTTTRGNSSKR